MLDFHTDLAMENLPADHSTPGVEVHRWQESDIELTEVIITNEEAARLLGKPMGNYLTLECPLLREHDPNARIAMTMLLGEELARMLQAPQNKNVLVVGLGNRCVTPDALGPAVIDKTLVTRHIQNSRFANAEMSSVCAIAPGVLGVTGIESVELLQCLTRALNPGYVICVDSLAARDSRRIGSAIQLSNTGIQPGSGVGNHRSPITRESLGVDVIAVGVPTVVYASTLARDAFSLLSDAENQQAGLEALERDLRDTELGNLIVTPRDIDAIIKNSATLLAGALNHALHPKLSEAEIAAMMD